MRTQYLLAHDLGTTGNKANIYSADGLLVASDFYGYSTSYPKPNWAEQNPEDWWQAVCVSTQRLLQNHKIDPADIAVVSFSGQMMGCVMVDNHGVPLRDCIIWADMRSEPQTAALKAKLSEHDVYQITGMRLSPAFTVEKVMWIRDNQPDLFAKTSKFLHAKDYVIYKLTGKFATDYSDASGTNAFDLTQRKWSPEIIAATGLPIEIFPEAHPSTTVIGEVTTAASRDTGLRPGTPVVMGGGDGSCAAVGAGVVREGSAYNYIGSSSWIALATSRPLLDPQQRTVHLAHLDPKMLMPLGMMQCAGGAYQWAKEVLGGLETRVAQDIGLSPYDLLNLKAEAAGCGAHNLLFLPYLLGERAPYWNPNARGVFLGLMMSHTREDMIRAVLEGVGFALRTILDAFLDQGVNIEAVRVIGGGARGRLLCQIEADIFQRKILCPELLEEATSLGAAIAGGVGVGIFKDFLIAEELVKIVETYHPNQQHLEKYEKLYRIFQNSYQSLAPIYDQLAALD